MRYQVQSVKITRIGLLTIMMLVSLVTSGQADYSIDGVWQIEGYGRILEIKGDQATIFEISKVSCLLVSTTAIIENRLNTDLGNYTIRVSDDHLCFTNHKGNRLKAYPIEALPPACQHGGTVRTPAPEISFEVLWHTVHENYPFFTQNNVDWDKQYAQYRPQINAATRPKALFDILSAMLAELDDAHASLIDMPYRSFSGGTKPAWASQVPTFEEAIHGNYLDQPIKIVGNGNLQYGQLGESIGYLNIMWLMDFARHGEDERTALTQALNQILDSFVDMDAVVIDVRFNGGGLDDYAHQIASRFADEKRLAYFKRFRHNDGLTEPQAFYVEPVDATRFTKPVIVLTSPMTMSAAETFVLCVQTLPHVTIVGEPTRGCFTDKLMRELPNGWLFTFSHQLRLSPEGEQYDNTGLPPVILVPLEPASFSDGYDNILETALEIIANGQ